MHRNKHVLGSYASFQKQRHGVRGALRGEGLPAKVNNSGTIAECGIADGATYTY